MYSWNLQKWFLRQRPPATGYCVSDDVIISIIGQIVQWFPSLSSDQHSELSSYNSVTEITIVFAHWITNINTTQPNGDKTTTEATRVGLDFVTILNRILKLNCEFESKTLDWKGLWNWTLDSDFGLRPWNWTLDLDFGLGLGLGLLTWTWIVTISGL